MGYEFKKVNCMVCGKDQTAYLGKRSPKSFTLPDELIAKVVKCTNCGLIFPNPMPFPDQQQLKQNYSGPNGYFPTTITEKRLRFYKTILEGIERFTKKGKLLDVGCGRGELLHLAQKRGWQACGAEISPSFAEYARGRFGLNVRVGEVKDLRFPDQEFDAISLVGVLQHTYNPKDLLSELNRILKKDGVLFIEAMNGDSLLYKWGDLYYKLKGVDKTTNLSPTFPSYQIYGFSVVSLARLLQCTGFKIAKMQVKGGISRTEKHKAEGFLDKLLLWARAMVMVAAELLHQGQVLVIYARKQGDLSR
ncbi:class I SAM-dependent methyltransferase [Candidatus Omnitrophota bacterium]